MILHPSLFIFTVRRPHMDSIRTDQCHMLFNVSATPSPVTHVLQIIFITIRFHLWISLKFALIEMALICQFCVRIYIYVFVFIYLYLCICYQHRHQLFEMTLVWSVLPSVLRNSCLPSRCATIAIYTTAELFRIPTGIYCVSSTT